jgi:hypothetical protein
MAFSLSHISETYSHAITKSMELHTTIKGHYRFISKGKAICDYLFIVIHNMHGIERKQLVEFFSSCEAIHFQCLFLVNLHYYCSLKTRNLDCLTLQHEVERITAFQTLWTTRSILHFISSHVFVYYIIKQLFETTTNHVASLSSPPRPLIQANRPYHHHLVRPPPSSQFRPSQLKMRHWISGGWWWVCDKVHLGSMHLSKYVTYVIGQE